MVNRKVFFDIFFYNKENPTRELMEMAENLWRNYMTKYGLGLDAGATVEPTYEEVREITYMANYAAEMIANRQAEEEARIAAQKKKAAEEELEALVMATARKPVVEIPEEPAEDIAENIAVDTPEESPEESGNPIQDTAIESTAEPDPEEAAEDTAEPVTEEVVTEIVPEVPVPFVPAETAAPVAKVPEKPAIATAPCGDVSLWVEQLSRWCLSKGMQCITTFDDDDCYLHVYLPHKKDVYTVGRWCFPKQTRLTDLAAEITKLYAYCEGFADCFLKLMK